MDFADAVSVFKSNAPARLLASAQRYSICQVIAMGVQFLRTYLSKPYCTLCWSIGRCFMVATMHVTPAVATA